MSHEDEHEPLHPDDRDLASKRPVILGGVVVALTLALAAWLAYGVVERSTTNPRAAGLVPGDTRGTSNSSTSTHTGAGGAGGGTTTTRRGATPSTTRAPGGGATTVPTTGAPGTSTPPVTTDSYGARWHAYSTAWKNECKSIWSDATNGKLYDRDDVGSAYTVDDCLGQLDPLFMTANVTSVAIATREGHNDAASFTSQLTLSGNLCWVDPATDVIKGCWTGV